MASLDELSTALQNAHSAGDMDAARTLAGEIIKLRGLKEPQKVGIAEDMGRGAVAGLEKAGIGLAGLPGDAMSLVGSLGKPQAAGPSASPKQPTPDMPQQATLPTSQDVQQYVEGRFGKLYEPQTVPGQFARTVGEFVPNAALPGGVLRRAANVVLPALTSEGAGQAVKGQPQEPYARVAGAMLGMPSVAGRAVTPIPASAERNRLVEVLRGEGVTSLTAGQRTGSKPLQWFEQTMSDLPLAGKGADRIAQQGKEQFTQAALRRVGENATRADDVTMDRALTRMGQQFDDLAARNTAQGDRQFVTEINQAMNGYYNLVEAPNRVPAVTNFAREIANQMQANNGAIPGPVYQSLRSRMESVARETTNNEARHAIRDLRNAVDDVMERSIQQSGNTGDLEAWREVRRQYRNYIPLERAATGAGSETAEGLISPSQLRNAVVAQGRRGYARGDGDYGELARAGEAILKPLPNSGTAPRSFAQALVSGGIDLSLLGLPTVAGRIATSAIPQAYLGNQLLAPALHGTRPTRDALIQALMYEPRLQLQGPRQ